MFLLLRKTVSNFDFDGTTSEMFSLTEQLSDEWEIGEIKKY